MSNTTTPKEKSKYIYIVSSQYVGTTGDLDTPKFKVFKHKKHAAEFLQEEITSYLEDIKDLELDSISEIDFNHVGNSYEREIYGMFYVFKREKIRSKL